MLIFFCDTATDKAVFGIGDGKGRAIASQTVEMRRNLSSRFFAVLDSVLADAKITFDEVDAFAVGLGPGSFTGVRIAVTTLRTLAQVTGKPIAGICTLDIYADQILREHPGATVAAQLPSRRNELYVGLYSSGSRELFAATLADAHARYLKRSPQLIVAGPESTRPTGIDCDFRPIDAPSADSFARLAASAFRDGQLGDPLSLNPLYVVAPAINQHLDAAETARLSR